MALVVILFGGTIGATADPLDAPPANDPFTGAIAIDNVPYVTLTDTTAATDEPGEPSPCGGMAATLWYTLTVADERMVVADTLESDFDTVLAAYTGDDLNALETIRCNDDHVSVASRIAFDAVPGTTYHLQAGGYYGDVGALRLHVATIEPGAVPNDAFGNATPIDPLPFSTMQGTAGATTEADEPVGCIFGETTATVWYSLDVEQPMVIQADSGMSEYWTSISVYTGDSLPTLARTTCGGSAVEFAAEPNVTYYLQVSGFEGDFGVLALDVNGLPGTPYVERNVWNGHLDCSAKVVVLAFSACSTAPSATDSFMHVFAVDEGIRTLTGTLDWNMSSPPFGDMLYLIVDSADGQVRVWEGSGHAPLHFRSEILPADPAELRFRVFADGDLVGAAVQQSFMIHYDEHYLLAAPWDDAEEPQWF